MIQTVLLSVWSCVVLSCIQHDAGNEVCQRLGHLDRCADEVLGVVVENLYDAGANAGGRLRVAESGPEPTNTPICEHKAGFETV